MFIRKGEVLDYWYCTNVYKQISILTFCKKHSVKTLHTHHRAQHKHVYSKLCLT